MAISLKNNEHELDTTWQEIIDFSPREIIDSSINLNIEDIIKLESVSRAIVSYFEIEQGNVHYIYKMVDKYGASIILKIRRDHLYSIKGIKKNPGDIQYEAKAYQIFEEFSIAPKLIKFNKEEHYMLLECIEGCSLEEMIDDIDENLIKKIASILQVFHTKAPKKPIRNNEKENQLYKNQLFYRFGFLKDINVSKLLLKMYKSRNGIIHGDLNPLNIFVNKKSLDVKLIDLEYAHHGNIEFDIGYFIAHLLIFMHDHDKLKHIIKLFFEEYQIGIALDEDMIVKVIASTLLYRLKSYFSYGEGEKKEYMTQLAQSIFSSDVKTVEDFQKLI